MTDPTLAALKAAEPKPIDESFLRFVVGCTTSYSEGWREVCARLLWAEERLRVLDAQAGETGWQPIETAPKDGAAILGFMRYYDVNYWGCLRWESFSDGSAGWVGGSFKTDPPGSFHAFMQPTHWMPWPKEPPR